MSLHTCPIEPSDWSDGPNEPEPNCPDCDGSGEVPDNGTNCGECETCNGTGYVDYEPDEP